jgi:DnaJ-class molecular chaperone
MNTALCPKCNGKGKVLTKSRQTGYDQEEVPCKMCKGSGRK